MLETYNINLLDVDLIVKGNDREDFLNEVNRMRNVKQKRRIVIK